MQQARNTRPAAPDRCRQWLDNVPDLLHLADVQSGRFPYLLESSATGALGRYSLLLYASDEVLVLEPEGALRGPGLGDDFFRRLQAWYHAERAHSDSMVEARGHGLPFAGGWFLYLGYEMAGVVEPTLRLPGQRTGLPTAFAHRCPGAVIVCHSPKSGEPDRAVAVAENPAGLEDILSCVGSAPDDRRNDRQAPPLVEVREGDPQRYRDAVRRIHDYLRAGDVFQVNVSREWRGKFACEPSPAHVYDSLRRANPAPFAGLMRWQDHCVLSSSPERLVQVRDGTVQTRPIAGTRPRGGDDKMDRSLSSELLSDLKERAEHVMLIDLERNDLGRVCRPGSIEVNELMVLESYAHVHHIVSNVRGELLHGADPVDALRAVFPGGTITGCPKVRCMEIIAELEQTPRGYYTGSMGYLGIDGGMDMNILIRSMLLHGSRFSFRTGAGIVADSDPQREVLETADKARGMLLAVDWCNVPARETNHA